MFRIVPVLFLVVLLGCGGAPDDAPTLAVVSGKVLLDGEPAKGLTIEFHPDSAAGTKGPMSTAVSNPDGTFHLYTAVGGDGAVIGTHKVVVKCQSRPAAGGASTADGYGSSSSGEAPPAANAAAEDCKLAIKYEDPATTPLKHVVPEKGIEDLVLQTTSE